MPDAEHPRDFERSDADPRLLAAFAGGIAAFLIGTPLLLGLAYPDARRGVRENFPVPPAPRLQITPERNFHDAEHQRQLSAYGRIDGSQTVVRIPIDRAMAILAERGLAGWPSGAQDAAPSAPPQ
jgi:hypothetical protein